MYCNESEIRKLQEQHKLWLKKGPYAYITTCGKDEKPCVLIDEKAEGFYKKKNKIKICYNLKTITNNPSNVAGRIYYVLFCIYWLRIKHFTMNNSNYKNS